VILCQNAPTAQNGGGETVALVLCTDVDDTLLQTRRLILEGAGHQVVPAMDEKALVAACKKHSVDVAVIGRAISPNVKRRVELLIRKHCRGAKILEVYTPDEGKTLEDADASLASADLARMLADRVHELATQKKKLSSKRR
jgi:hypothetical protein